MYAIFTITFVFILVVFARKPELVRQVGEVPLGILFTVLVIALVAVSKELSEPYPTFSGFLERFSMPFRFVAAAVVVVFVLMVTMPFWALEYLTAFFRRKNIQTLLVS